MAFLLVGGMKPFYRAVHDPPPACGAVRTSEPNFSRTASSANDWPRLRLSLHPATHRRLVTRAPELSDLYIERGLLPPIDTLASGKLRRTQQTEQQTTTGHGVLGEIARQRIVAFLSTRPSRMEVPARVNPLHIIPANQSIDTCKAFSLVSSLRLTRAAHVEWRKEL